MALKGSLPILGVILFASAALGGIRHIDFKNFSYPWDNAEQESPWASEALP
jgi:hypothetical protein